jgi:hypothetical protein
LRASYWWANFPALWRDGSLFTRWGHDEPFANRWYDFFTTCRSAIQRLNNYRYWLENNSDINMSNKQVVNGRYQIQEQIGMVA